jgi:uncharacterized protein YcfL
VRVALVASLSLIVVEQSVTSKGLSIERSVLKKVNIDELEYSLLQNSWSRRSHFIIARNVFVTDESSDG